LLKSEYASIPCFHIRVPPVKGGISTRMKTALRFHMLGLWTALGKDFRCDVVLSQSPPLTTGLFGNLFAWWHSGKSVYIVQDIFPDGLIRQGRVKNKLLIAFIRLLERLTYRSCDAVTGISNGFIRILRLRVPKQVHLEKIPNFVSPEVYKPLPRQNDYASKHGLDDCFVVSYVGNIGNGQDLTPVLAAARACADLPIRFIIVGDGIRRQELEAQAKQGGMGNVEFWGYQPRESTPWINASTDIALILLAPHVGSFGLPSKVYTLMASGKPIVFYGDPSSDLAELVTSLNVGWVVPSGDHQVFAELIRNLYQQRDSLAPFGERGIQAVQEQFTVQCVARQYHELITRLMAGQCMDTP
jgi:colanic acid biosynthesis glycosyl transferase WcaI